MLLSTQSDDGTRTEVGSLCEGLFFGQSTLISGAATDSAYALDEVTVVRIEREVVEAAVQNNPVLLTKFGRAIDDRRAAVLRALEDNAAQQSDNVAG